MEQRRVRPEAGRGRRAGWSIGWWIGLGLALGAAAALRLYRLPEQILTGDELHTVNGALTRSVGEILRTWTFHGADYAVPLTAFFRILMDRGFVLDEMTLRTPGLVASLLTVALLPLALRRRLGPWPAALLAWLLAISPMLVLYGRIVRSYAPLILLSAAAALAFEAWWRRGSRAAGAAYVALAAGSVHLHLGALTLVLAPFAYAAGHATLEPARRERLGGLAALLGATGLAIALLLLPARDSLRELIGIHGAGRAPLLGTWLEVSRLQAGTASTLLLAAVLAALARGAWILVARDRAFALYLGALAVCHVVGLVLLAPNFLHAAIVTNRYVLPLLPFALALVALGLAAPVVRVPAALQAALVAGFVAALFLGGPLGGAEFRWSSFTHTQPFILLTREGDRIPDERVPAFYRELARDPGAIAEAPWTNVGTHSFAAYQRVHRQPVRVVSAHPIHADPRLALRNTIPFDPEVILASDARWLVVHGDLRSEEQHVETPELRHGERLERLAPLWQGLRHAATRMDAELERSFGPPDQGDARPRGAKLRVWDLERVRRERPGGAAPQSLSSSDATGYARGHGPAAAAAPGS